MATQKFIRLLEELSQATGEGKVRWHETAAENVFRVVLGDGMVRIESFGEGMDQEYRAFLLNQKGWIMDELSVRMDDEDLFTLLDNLYTHARRSALNVDKLVESMLADLKAG
jgi:hypothetical protein